jgi:hypothetical protein
MNYRAGNAERSRNLCLQMGVEEVACGQGATHELRNPEEEGFSEEILL